MRSIHDNVIYAHAIDYQAGRIVLHTQSSQDEYTDAVFEGVVTHHFEQQSLGAPSPQAVLFDISPEDPEATLRSYQPLLERTKDHGWPGPNYESLSELARKLTESGARCYRVQGQCGIEGFVFAMDYRLERQEGRS